MMKPTILFRPAEAAKVDREEDRNVSTCACVDFEQGQSETRHKVKLQLKKQLEVTSSFIC